MVRLPATATLLFDGMPTMQKGTYRRFVTNDLIPKLKYYYILRATWQENGHDVTRIADLLSLRPGNRRKSISTCRRPNEFPRRPCQSSSPEGMSRVPAGPKDMG